MIVLALVAASVAISVSFVWGLHLHRSPSPVNVTSLDTHSAPRFDTPARGSGDGLESFRDSGSPGDLNSDDELDRRLNEPDDPSLDEPSTEPDPSATSDPDADKYSSPLSDPDSSLGGTSKDTAGLDPSESSAPSAGRRTPQRPRDEGYPDDSRYPDSEPDRPRPRLPSLGGL